MALSWRLPDKIILEVESADWTELRPHLAGAFANALLRSLTDRKLLRAGAIARALELTPAGRVFFRRLGVRVSF
jgi:hypothetical protein